MELKWEDGFTISVQMDHGAVVLSANEAGLLSLVNHLEALAKGEPGDHIHLDQYNALEDGSAELIIEKIPE